MPERPILYSAPMIRAKLAGVKTQTRRMVKPQPGAIHDGEPYWFVGGYRAWEHRGVTDILRMGTVNPLVCPYGKPGEKLWSRETWRTAIDFDKRSPLQIAQDVFEADNPKPWAPIKYEADGETVNADTLRSFGGAWGKTRVSIHMPRWASRITDEIVSVRVERLHDISEADALAEGVVCDPGEDGPYYFVPGVGYGGSSESAVGAYRKLWESINGPGSWALNPWVWVITTRPANV